MVAQIKEWEYGMLTGGIKSIVLKRDLRRGVRFLSDSSYSDYTGVTRISIMFFNEVMKHVDLTKVYRADLTLTKQHWYTVRLYTKEGYVIQFKGLSFGYYGEGSRGTHAILKECGFTTAQIHRIFKHDVEFVRMFKRVA